jgi:hypothetical protein
MNSYLSELSDNAKNPYAKLVAFNSGMNKLRFCINASPKK